MTSPTDQELVEKIRAGDPEAFALLVDRYGRGLYVRLRRQVRSLPDVEDLLQEVFLTAYTRLGQLQEGERLAGWLAAIADNHLRRWQRRRWVQLKWEVLFRPGDWAEDPGEDTAEQQDLRHWVRLALQRLSQADQQVIIHHYFKGYSYLETAALLGLEVDTVRSRLQKGRNRLKKEVMLMVREREVSQEFALSGEDLQALRWAGAFVSQDPQRPVLQGVYLDAGGKIIATDGFRLFFWKARSLEGLQVPVLLGPWQGVEILQAPEATLIVGSKEAVLRCPGGSECRIPVMEGPYVKYEQVIPPEGKIRAQVEAGLLLEVLEQMASHLEPRHPPGQAGIQGYTPQVELHLSALGQTLSLVTTRDMGYTWQEGKKPLAGGADWTFISSVPARIQGIETDALFRMGVNHTYLRTAIQALGSGAGEPLDLHFTNPLQAVQFTAPTHPNRRTLQMPMKLQAG